MVMDAEKEMLDFIRRVCDECGGRIGGSEGERKAGEIVEDELKKFCDSVHREQFKCHPQAFLDYIWITFLLYILAVAAHFSGYSIITPILILAGILLYHLQQNLHYEIVDFLFPEKESFHVYGKIMPVGEADRIAILSAHHDSAYEFPLLGRYRKKGVYFVVLTVSVILAVFFLSLLVLLLPHFRLHSIAGAVEEILSPVMVLGAVMLFIVSATLRSGKVVLGANDNLSSLAAVIEAGRYLSANRPERTEVWIISFAGEEHMRGSKRFVARHLRELKEMGAVMLNFECVSSKHFLLATEEKMFRVRHSARAVELAKSAAEKSGVDVTVAPLPFAGSDAANFSRKGIDATVIFGVEDDGIPRHWHTLDDTPDKIEPEKLVQTAKIAVEFIYEVDSSER